jgi:hypothetical protein
LRITFVILATRNRKLSFTLHFVLCTLHFPDGSGWQLTSRPARV